MFEQMPRTRLAVATLGVAGALLVAPGTLVSGQGEGPQFKMHEKYKPGDPYNPDRFVDPTGFLASVVQLEKAYLGQLTRERQR